MTHLAIIAAIPCVVCSALGMQQEGRTYVHHMRAGQGMSQRAPDELGIALCYEHHQGKTGIHGDRSAWSMARMDEPMALAATIRAAYGGNARPIERQAKPLAKIVRHPGFIRP